MQIETERLVLRGWRDQDVEAWAAMEADDRVMEFFAVRSDRARALDVAARLRATMERNGYGWWVVEVKGGTAFAGVIGLQEVPFEAHFTPATEVGWRLLPEEWGKGYATEGARAVLAFAFDTLGRSEMVAMTAQLNVRSQRVMERLGMTRDERDDFDNPRVAPGHALRPHVLYRIQRGDAARR